LRIFPENPIAHLLFADVAVQEGRRDLAGRGYFDFWEHAGSQSKFLSDVLNEEERQVVASHISGRLFLYGMELPGDEHPKDLPLRLNLSDTKKKSFSDVIVSFALPTLIAIGIPFFIFTRFFSSDASPNADRLLFQVYLVILLSYLLWLAQQHLKFGPFFFAPKFEIFIFFTGGLCVVLALQVLRNVWEHERERLNPETVFCRYCGKSILKLAIVCPFCNEEVHAKTRKK
jgi:hypothetical protein